jgi:hypothetical protein
MQVEEQNQSALKPKIAVQADSDESKSKRGGNRPGAGRKPNLAKRLLKGFSRDTIAGPLRTSNVGTSLAC